jgi:hypothetical protein
MSLQITAKQHAGVSHDGIDIVQLAGAGNLFVEDAVKLRVDAVGIDRGLDELAGPHLDRARCDLEKVSRTTCDKSAVWRSMTAATSASLLGKYWYSEPMLTPATAAILLVLARS